MKAQILKIAGVKTEKEFYKKYKTEADFMKVHGKAFKKAQMGTVISGSGDKLSNPKLINLQNMYDEADMDVTGMTDEMRQKQAAALQSSQAPAPSSGGGGGGGDMFGSIFKMLGGAGGGAGGEASGGGMGEMASALAKYGADIPRAQTGWNGAGSTNYGQPQQPYYGPASQQPVQSVGSLQPAGNTPSGQNLNQLNPLPTSQQLNAQPGQEEGIMDTIAKKAGPVGQLYGSYQALRGERRARKAAEQQKAVSDITLKASQTRPEQIQRKYVRPEDIQNTGEEFFPIYGVGTNPLARNGRYIHKAQDGTIETPEVDAVPTDWYEEGMDKDTYYGFKKQLDDAGYTSIAKPQSVNIGEMQDITEAQPQYNQLSDQQSSEFMETYNRDQGNSTSSFDSNSARDNWVQKTGLPWSEAKRLGYTSGSAKDNTKLLGELNDPRFKKENLRTVPSKNSSNSRTPVQHRETPSGRLTPIKPQSYAEAMKGKPKYSGNQGNIGTPDEGNMITRLGERLANPLQTFGEYIKYGELPSKGFSKYSKNAFDQVLGLKNPAYWANAVGNASDYASEGEYRKAVIEAADALPALGKLKYVKNVPFAKGLPAAKEFIKRAGYLGEGAKRISGPASKQLGQATPKLLQEGFTPNFVMYKNGGGIGGNPTEIQNTYGNGNSIYDDLGYEPLTDPNQVKSFYHGGRLHSMQDGGGTPWGQIGEVGSQVAGQASGGPNAGGDIGGQLGGTLGEAAGNAIAPGIGGPIGKAIGQVGGTLAGGFLDTNPKAIKRNQAATRRNIQTMALNSGFQGIQGQNASYVRDGGDIPNYEDGGYMNPEYNPQVITMFGDHDSQDFADYAHKDEFRAGGHLKAYTPPSERAMETYENGGGVKSYGLGGELQTHWGGGAETMSYNPYLPGTGETVMFRGKSHEEYSPNGETGIGVTYGGNPVEVERGEPMVELEEGGTVDPQTGEVQKSGVVFGNLKIPNQYIDMLGDKSAKGKKFKNYVADLSKTEAKQNKLIEKSTNELDAFTPITSFDKLKLTALQANIQGANMKLKDIADKKINAASLQNAINDTAEEHGLVADDLARGKVKIDKKANQQYAKFGGNFKKAQDGYKTIGIKPGTIDYNPIGQTSGGDLWKDETTYENVWKPKVYSAFNDPRRAEELIKNIENYKGQDASDVQAAIAKGKTPEEKKAIAIRLATDKKVGPFHEIMNQVIDYKLPTTTPTTTKTILPNNLPLELPKEKGADWMNIINAAIPYLRPSDQEALDMEQLYPEMYAMSSNQLEPVPAQGYQPDLGVPYDISLQDQLNANQADYRSMQRMVGYNPAAQANLNAQKYQANQQVLGNQFRANQEMKDKVYGENRNILNQAKLTNLGIYDKQYERQAQALSNTKATTQAALNSIADKYAKNKLENRTLGVYENMYNYRYDDQGRAINMNPLAQFNTEGRANVGSPKNVAPEGYEYETILKKKKEKDVAKNGSIVKSYKNI
jgi:hypothetical protein